MTTIRNILLATVAALPLFVAGLPFAQAASHMYCDGDYCGDYYIYDPDYRHGSNNWNYWSSSLPYSYYYPSSSYYYYPYSYSYSYPTYYYPSYSYPYQYQYPQYQYQNTYPANLPGVPQYPGSGATYKDYADYYKKLSDYYKALSDYYKKLDDINK